MSKKIKMVWKKIPLALPINDDPFSTAEDATFLVVSTVAWTVLATESMIKQNNVKEAYKQHYRHWIKLMNGNFLITNWRLAMLLYFTCHSEPRSITLWCQTWMITAFILKSKQGLLAG